MTHNEIKERLRANGNPSIFEAKVLAYIEELEAEVKLLSAYKTKLVKQKRECYAESTIS